MFPPIDHGDGTITLWHPDSPGTRLRVEKSWLRKLGVVRSEFAITGEVLNYYRKLKLKRYLEENYCPSGVEHKWEQFEYVADVTVWCPSAEVGWRCTRCGKEEL